MKIKFWLLITFFIVMILPIGSVYGLYVWINTYYQDKNVAEYLEKWTELEALKVMLDDPTLYNKNNDFSAVEALSSDQVGISLYSQNGFIYYSSNPLSSVFISKDDLFRDLFEFQKKYNAFTYKEPIYQKGELVGLYEVQLVRTDWVQEVERRSFLVIGGVITLFILIYGIVIWLLQSKLNRPLQELMQQMRAFAKGEDVKSDFSVRKDEIGEVAQTFFAMQREIEASRTLLKKEQEQKELMIASISHDLKTPLTAIQTYAESLQNKKLTVEEQCEYRQVILKKSTLMKQMLEDLLMYTLLQSTSYDLELVEVEGAEFFEMALSEYEPLCINRGFALDVMCEVEGIYAVHPKQLQRVIDNLMSNAWRYGEPGSVIGLAAVNAGDVPKWCFDFVKLALTKRDGMYIIVQNCGQGVKEQEIAKLFEPMYQADDARTKAGQRGSGLGLNIAKQIVNKHGGTVEMVSQDGIGTAVLCWLP
ncbi:ATP-binding protein [Lysinibacillus sp. NPDC096418]|uniref:HAMP domain-containing sensor histidine kinase n=1 Tax=Lysinibacillus sp. NPDC096418 TaxID=3364138 RepID=UPI00382AA267